MANASATPKTPRRRRRRRRVTFLARTCHRLLRLLATHRLRRGGHGLNSISAGDDSPPSGQPPRGRDAEEAEATQAAAAAQRRHEERHGDDDAAATEEAEAAVAGSTGRSGAASSPLRPRRADGRGGLVLRHPGAHRRRAGRPRAAGILVLDAFAGVGGNSIQFAARHAAATTSISLHLQPRSLTTPSPLQGLLRGRRGDRPPEGGARGAQRQDLRRRRHDRVRRRRFLPPRALLEGMLIPLLNDTEKETKKNEASMLRI